MCKKDFMIKKWMISELGLSGNDLVAYAFLYDATGKGENEYQGGYKQMTEVMNTTIPTTYNVLKRMAEKALRFMEFRTISPPCSSISDMWRSTMIAGMS